MRDFEFTLLEGPVHEAAPIRLFGVDIYPENPELKEVDLLSNIDARWKIQKKLSKADVDANTGQLQLLKADVEAHILPLLDEEETQNLVQEQGEGSARTWSVPVRLVDDDKGALYDDMKLTFYKNRGSYMLNGRWTQICKDRHLQNNDKVGLYWDRYEKEFRFAVLDRAREFLSAQFAGR